MALSDALIQWMYLSYISYHDIDVEHWRDIHGSGIRKFAARTALFLSLTSSVLRDVLTNLLTVMIAGWDSNPKEKFPIDSLMKGVYVFYSGISFAFHLFIAKSLLGPLFGPKHLGRDILLLPYLLLGIFLNTGIIVSVESSYKRLKEQGQKYKCKLLLCLAFLAGTIAVISSTTTLVLEVWRPETERNGSDSSLSPIYAVASTWTYSWIANGGAERASQLVCTSPNSNDPVLVLLMVNFRPTAHNIHGILLDELAAGEQAQSGNDKVDTPGRERHAAGDTPDVPLVTQPASSRLTIPAAVSRQLV